MRLRVALFGFLGLLLALPAWNARAAAAVDLVWITTTGSGEVGTSEILAAPGDEITLELRLTAGPEGISSYGISLLFDSDLMDELDLVSATELLPNGLQFNITDGVQEVGESDMQVIGFVNTLEAGTVENGPVDETFAIGEVVFSVNGAMDGNLDVVSGLWNVGVDDIFDNAGISLAQDTTFGAASVPEPGSAAAAGAALAALAALRRRRQSSSIDRTIRPTTP